MTNTGPTSRQPYDVLSYCFDRYQEINRALGGGPPSYYMKRMKEYTDALFGRFSPFHKLDRVRLTADIECKDGWAGMEKTLCKDAVGTVTNVDYRDDRFCAHVVFDKEIYTDPKGKEYPARDNDRHSWLMYEGQIEVVKATQAKKITGSIQDQAGFTLNRLEMKKMQCTVCQEQHEYSELRPLITNDSGVPQTHMACSECSRVCRSMAKQDYAPSTKEIRAERIKEKE